MSVIGFKGLDRNFTCRGYHFRVGRTVWKNSTPVICRNGFHFCMDMRDVFDYYPWHECHGHRYAIVEADGVIVGNEDNSKFACSRMKVLRELSRGRLTMYFNEGDGNTGLYNRGDDNSGCSNLGSYNTGDGNIGHFNSGDLNVGDYNQGKCNTGSDNTGMFNKADFCSGAFNTKDGSKGMFNKPWRGQWNIPNWIYEAALWNMDYTYLAPVQMTDEMRLAMPDDMDIMYGHLYTVSDVDQFVFRRAFMRAAAKVLKIHWIAYDRIIRETESMPNFDWGIFEEITGISKPWMEDALNYGMKEEVIGSLC